MTPAQSNFEVIDLITPPDSPTRQLQSFAASIGSSHLLCESRAGTSDGHVQQLSSGSENEIENRKTALGKRKAIMQLTQHNCYECIPPEEESSSVLDECVIVAAPPSRRMGTDPLAHRASASGSTENDDEEVCFVGRTGNLALVDFPHARYNCGVYPWAPGATAAARCGNCWCYVCDANASRCPEWSTHCQATNKEAKWRELRTAWSKPEGPPAAPPALLPQRGAPPAPALPLSAARTRTPLQPPVAVSSILAPLDHLADKWTAERVMQEVAQVYPLEEPEPEGLRASLRPYQKQSLAFMLNMERAPEYELLLGEREVQRRDEANPPQGPMRGGWLCDETGMGKTCVCAALILAQPRPAISSARDLAELRCRAQVDSRERLELTIDGKRYDGCGSRWSAHQPSKHVYLMEEHKETALSSSWRRKTPEVTKPNPEWEAWTPPPTVHLGATVVVTSNALLCQWQDELRKFAPSLRVATYFGSRAAKDAVFAKLQHLDVVLTTYATSLFGFVDMYMNFERLIIDESHTTDKGKLGFEAIAARCKFVWGVTATPITSSVDDLGVVAELLGQKKRLKNACSGTRFTHSVVALLRRLMIRHTKSQRIGGAVALALPEADAQTVWLEMKKDERAKYDDIRQAGLQEQGALLFALERRLQQRRYACAGVRAENKIGINPDGSRSFRVTHDGAKAAALLADLEALRREDAAVHAVVFTHHVDCYEHLRKRLKAAGFGIYGFKGGDPVRKRHDTIRKFQASIDAAQPGVAPAADTFAKVFIATIKVGNMGLTLTAATRVYLMEPCLDPSMEVQAAGRIHRLGQTKEVLVKRFCYRNSIDASVVEMHEKMRRGKIVISNGFFPKAAIDLLLRDRSGC
uniref:Helicase ATP-binding domain-containing protein n=1 Tax=Chrysotila carterae TaxID=13221 RepID=A0A7S4BGJ8_CHRCT